MNKPILIILGLICMITIVIALLVSIWPEQENSFIELGLLGKDKTADSYFVDVHSRLSVGVVNNWFIYLHNHMEDSVVVSVRVKLLSSESQLPDDRSHQPSNVEAFAEFPFFLSIKDTVFFPFIWSINSVESQNSLAIIKGLFVNGQSVTVSISGVVDSSFIIVFELWVQDSNNGNFSFGWKSNEGLSSASIFMGFTLNNGTIEE